MANTLSNMLPLGTKAPDFELWDPRGEKKRTLSELKSDKATLVVFMCNHCPFVLHIIHELQKYALEYTPKDVSIIGINSNDIEKYPQDAPEKMVEFAENYDIFFPYLYDESQETAKAYEAACTPDFFLFGADMKLKYRGQFDASRPSNDIPVTGSDLRKATDLLLLGKEIDFQQVPSIGCNIKWK